MRVVAFLLSLVAPGGGHALLGRWRRGLLWVAAFLLNVAAYPVLHAIGVGLTLLVLLATAVDTLFVRRETARWETTLAAVVVLAAVPWGVRLGVTAAYLEAFKLPAGSMMPTLLVGDHIYVAKYDRTPAAGDVIVFVYPKDPSKSFVKRVVGMPGDVVELKDGGLLVNGVATATSTGTPCTVYDYNEMLERWEVKRPTCRDEVLGEHHFQTLHEETSRDFPPFTVPPAHYFVLGDNRDNSHDSRYWGPVPAENVLGTASFIWWSTGEPEGVRFARLNQIVR